MSGCVDMGMEDQPGVEVALAVDLAIRFRSTLTDEAGVVTDDDFTGYTFEAPVCRWPSREWVADLGEFLAPVADDASQVDLHASMAQLRELFAPGNYRWHVVAISGEGERSYLVPPEPFVVSDPEPTP